MENLHAGEIFSKTLGKNRDFISSKKKKKKAAWSFLLPELLSGWFRLILPVMITKRTSENL